MKLYEPQVLFLDNSKIQTKNVARYCPRVKIIKIRDSGEKPIPISFLDADFVKLLNSIGPNNTYYKALVNVYFKTSLSDNYDKNSGIQDDVISFLNKWTTYNPKSPHFIVIDFDRTLTMFEGIITERDGIDAINKKVLSVAPHLSPVTIEDVVTYLCGGKERLEKLRLLFKHLLSHYVKIFILTNNGTCSLDPKLLTSYLDAIISPDSYKLVCSRDVLGGNKGAAFATMRLLHGLCGIQKTRKHRVFHRRAKNLKTQHRRQLSH